MAAAVKEKPEAQTKLIVPDEREQRSSPHASLPAPANLMQALALAAADPRMELAKVQGLWAMHKEMMDRESERAFNDAMARAQARMEPIVRDRKNEHTKSMYATLAAINEAITPIHTAEGLSVTYDSYTPEFDKDGKEINPPRAGWFRTIAICAHSGGFARRYYIDLPLDDAGKDGSKNKTGVQAMGSTNEYARRYLKKMIFDITTANADNDGNGGGGGSERMNEKTISRHLDLINGSEVEADILKRFAAAYNEAEELKDKDAQRQFLGARDNRRKELKGGRR